MSLTFKLLSLAIRTAAKPIGNYIKKQAKEHDGFRAFAVAQAQRLHRIDMRMRLGILHDPAAQQRMHDREQRAADEKKRQAETPTVRSELEQKKHDEEKAKEEKEASKKEKRPRKVQIRPLSEARAIELGANFFSEAFIFAVAAGLLIWDSWRSRRKESQRRDDVAERLQELEGEVALLKAHGQSDTHDISELIERIKDTKKSKTSWWQTLGWPQASTQSAAEEAPKNSQTATTKSEPAPDAVASAQLSTAVNSTSLSEAKRATTESSEKAEKTSAKAQSPQGANGSDAAISQQK